MNPNLHAFRTGLGRGWHEFRLSVRSPQDQAFYIFQAAGVLLFLYFNRTNEIEGTGLLYSTVAMPSIIGALIMFGLVVGPAYALAMEREDGTLLRAKAVPRGIVGYVTGQVLLHSLSLLPMLVVILVPGAFIVEGMMSRGAAGWVTMTWVVLLGLLATMPIGIVIGSLVPGIQKMGTWGILPIMVLGVISGIFYPIQELWGWVQGVAQVFPMYWLGHGMRAAFLPDAAAAIELGGSWRLAEAALVLGAWAIVGFIVAPIVLARMARRQSGSQVEAAREQALQWIR
ncbi:MAG TPA: ABC transporter permease [Acidimicrobiia bacterium]|nr:ABC transporter permease [Acidimicrobiia bacterium]